MNYTKEFDLDAPQDHMDDIKSYVFKTISTLLENKLRREKLCPFLLFQPT